MGRPERPLDGTDGPIAEFAYDLRALRHLKGNPSYRELARTALFAPSVLSSAASGYRLPTLPVTLAFVTACGADRATWERRWRKVAENVGALTESRDERLPADPVPAEAEPARQPPRPSTTLARPAQLPMGSNTFVGRRQALAGAAHAIGQGGPAKVPLITSGTLAGPLCPIARAAPARAWRRPTKVFEPIGSWAGRANMVAGCEVGRGVSASVAALSAGGRSSRESGSAPTFSATLRQRRSQVARSAPQAVTNAKVTGRVGSR